MKLLDIRKTIYAVCVLVVCNLLIGLIWITADELISEGVTYRLKKSQDGISVQQFLQVDVEDVTVFLCQFGQIPEQGQVDAVSVGYIQGDVQTFLGAELLYGTWELERDAVLISESMAIQMFKRSDCLGCQMTVQGKTYSVCGVYRLQGGLMRDISEDGKEMVLLDLEEAQETWSIEALLFQGNQQTIGQNTSVLEERFEGKLKQNYREDNHNHVRRMLNQIPYIQVLLLAVWAIFVGAFRIVNAANAFYKDVVQNRTERKSIYRFVFSTGIWSLAILVAAKLLVFDLYIPENMFSEQSQILSIAPYFRSIIDFFQWHNEDLLGLWYIRLACLSIVFESILSVIALKNWVSILVSILILLTRRGKWNEN